MSDLIVIGYPDAATAEQARDEIFGMVPEDRLRFSQLSEAVVATRDANGRIKLSHLVHLWPLKTGTGFLWGLYVGAIFFHPIFGLIGGSAAGLIAGALADIGIDEEFVKAINGLLQPGKAALLLRHKYPLSDKTNEAIVDKLTARGGEVLRTTLNPVGERKLRRAIREAQRHAPGAAPSEPRHEPKR